MSQQEPEIGRAAFLPAVLPHVWVFSLAVGMFTTGFSLPDPFRIFLISVGGSSSVLFGVVLVFDFTAQCELHTIHYDRQAALIAQIRPPEPVKVISEPAIAFPPERFVTWLWNQRQLTGAIPTVDECVKANYTRQLVQVWFAEMVSSGAIIGREERGSSGDFAPGWTLERCATASRRANTLTALPGQRVA
jgi:hypothetical protein